MTDLAQDLNHILSVILGLAELAATDRHIRGDAKLARYLAEIRRSGQCGCDLLRERIMGGRSRPDDAPSR